MGLVNEALISSPWAMDQYYGGDQFQGGSFLEPDTSSITNTDNNLLNPFSPKGVQPNAVLSTPAIAQPQANLLSPSAFPINNVGYAIPDLGAVNQDTANQIASILGGSLKTRNFTIPGDPNPYGGADRYDVIMPDGLSYSADQLLMDLQRHQGQYETDINNYNLNAQMNPALGINQPLSIVDRLLAELSGSFDPGVASGMGTAVPGGGSGAGSLVPYSSPATSPGGVPTYPGSTWSDIHNTSGSGTVPTQGASIPYTPSGQSQVPNFVLPSESPYTTSPYTPGPTSNAYYDGGQAGVAPADQWLAALGPDIGFLQGIAENAGYATDATPAWQSMIEAQQRNLDERAADLTEQFNVSGNRFSSSFGNAMTDFWNQATLDQNSLLGQLTLQSQEAARGRELSAASGLASGAYGGIGQLSSQNFQSQLTQMQQGFQAASQLYGSQEAARQTAAQMIAQLGAQGAMALLSGSITGTQGLFGAESDAIMAEVQRQLQLQGMTLDLPYQYSTLNQGNLGLGATLGGLQYGLSQDQIDRMYQEWQRIQPYNSPLLPMLYSAATGYPPYYYPQQTPTTFQTIMGSLGGILGGVGSLIP